MRLWQEGGRLWQQGGRAWQGALMSACVLLGWQGSKAARLCALLAGRSSIYVQSCVLPLLRRAVPAHCFPLVPCLASRAAQLLCDPLAGRQPQQP